MFKEAHLSSFLVLLPFNSPSELEYASHRKEGIRITSLSPIPKHFLRERKKRKKDYF